MENKEEKTLDTHFKRAQSYTTPQHIACDQRVESTIVLMTTKPYKLREGSSYYRTVVS